jgi:alpha,alpha-trehalase
MAEHERPKGIGDDSLGPLDSNVELDGAPPHPSTSTPPSSSSSPSPPPDLWCSGPLLRAVQLLGLFDDCKHFVDMPLLTSTEEVTREFEELVEEAKRKKKEKAQNDGDKEEEKEETLPTRRSLLSVVERHFAPPGTELEAFEPPDFSETPRDFLPRVAAAAPSSSEGGEEKEREQVRAFALRVHRLWPQLCRRRRRRTTEAPTKQLQSSSLLETGGWSVVPGERFRESYYWDSYWTLRGLLASRMPLTAAAVVRTLCELAGKAGSSGGMNDLVPNGARTYYRGRSQPPLLADAAAALFLGCCSNANDAAAIEARKVALEVALPVAKAEHAAWCRWPRTVRVEVEVEGGSKKVASFARYFPHSAPGPRPEAWREDTELAAEFLSSSSCETDRKELWMALAAAAESGWDFSTRWLAGGVAGGRGGKSGERGKRNDGDNDGDKGDGDEATTKNPSPPNPRLGLAHLVIPVDLNVFLARAEAALSTLCLAAGEVGEAKRFAGLAGERLGKIDELLWDPATRSWADLALISSSAEKCGEDQAFRAEMRNAGRYASCWSPLWARRRVAEAAASAAAGSSSSSSSELDLQAVSSLLSSGIICPGGLVSASLEKGSKEQWDGDNGWPPLQAILAEGCADAFASSSSSSSASAAAAAAEVAATLSERIVRALVLNVRNGLARDGCVREKYRSDDAENRGKPGEGGEYETQVGFGWSNGAVLCLLRRFGWPASARGAAEAGEVGD